MLAGVRMVRRAVELYLRAGVTTAQSGGAELTKVPAPIVAGIQAQAEQVTRGLGGQIAWPGLLRKLDRRDPSFRD